jgi:transcriptional regulator with XRE-family HTH domain
MPLTMYFSENIKLLRKRKKRSQEDVAVALDLTRTTLSGYENGSAEPSLGTLMKFSDYYKVSVDKLLKTDLTKLTESALSTLEKGFDIDVTGRSLRVLTTTVNNDNEENIELVPVKAKAGYTSGYADPDYIKVLQTFNLPFLDRNRKYRSFQISGDSMPPVSNGSWVTGEYLQNWNHVKDGYPYIVVTKDDGVVFKVLYNKVKDKGTFMLCSTNPEYSPYEVPVGEIYEIWKFSNYISSELPEANISKDRLTNTVMNLQRELAEIKAVIKASPEQLSFFKD